MAFAVPEGYEEIEEDEEDSITPEGYEELGEGFEQGKEGFLWRNEIMSELDDDPRPKSARHADAG